MLNKNSKANAGPMTNIFNPMLMSNWRACAKKKKLRKLKF